MNFHFGLWKIEITEVGHVADMWQLKINVQAVKCGDEFSYPGSLVTNNSGCDKYIRTLYEAN